MSRLCWEEEEAAVEGVGLLMVGTVIGVGLEVDCGCVEAEELTTALLAGALLLLVLGAEFKGMLPELVLSEEA